jgi:catechol 2,3-dioxygenase-like lactoylglutathione lyase family enzyme
MVYKYENTRLLVPNFKACFLFYSDVLGFTATFGTEDDVYADFNTGSTIIALFEQHLMSATMGTSSLPAQASAQDKACLVFAVDDVDITCRQLQQQAVEIIAGPADRPDWGIRAAHFRDPAGNLIEINQPLHTH